MTELIARIRRRAQSDAVAYRDGDRSLTYAELVERMDSIAAAARAVAIPGSAVLIRFPNDLNFAAAFLGVLSAGCNAFPISTESPAAEVESIISRCHAVACISDRPINGLPSFTTGAAGEHPPAARRQGEREGAKSRRKTRRTAAGGAHGATRSDSSSSLSSLLRLPFRVFLRAFAPSRSYSVPTTDRLAPPAPKIGNLLLLSSGSTGRPKIVRRSAASLDTVCRQMVDGIGITAHDRVLATVPLCHSYGLEHGLLAPLWAGTCVHLVRGLDLPRVLAELSDGITVLPGVPSMFELLRVGTVPGCKRPGLSTPRLRIAYSAGGPLPLSVAERFRESCGVSVGQIYGATEVGSITYSDADPTTVGRPLAGVDLRFDDGRVLVKADSMFDEYLDDPSPLVDGYYPTGDLGHLDAAGRLAITGRSTLLIDVGGLKVNPIEVEAVLSAHPAVADSVVIPVRQSETVVRLKAILTPRNPDDPPLPDDIRRFARERLAGYKVPREIEVRPTLPRTETGKVLRQQVQA